MNERLPKELLAIFDADLQQYEAASGQKPTFPQRIYGKDEKSNAVFNYHCKHSNTKIDMTKEIIARVINASYVNLSNNNRGVEPKIQQIASVEVASDKTVFDLAITCSDEGDPLQPHDLVLCAPANTMGNYEDICRTEPKLKKIDLIIKAKLAPVVNVGSQRYDTICEYR